jgi:hypothetical protein
MEEVEREVERAESEFYVTEVVPDVEDEAPAYVAGLLEIGAEKIRAGQEKLATAAKLQAEGAALIQAGNDDLSRFQGGEESSKALKFLFPESFPGIQKTKIPKRLHLQPDTAPRPSVSGVTIKSEGKEESDAGPSSPKKRRITPTPVPPPIGPDYGPHLKPRADCVQGVTLSYCPVEWCMWKLEGDSNNNSVVAHIGEAHGGPKFVCDKCGKVYASPGTLQKHQKKGRC